MFIDFFIVTNVNLFDLKVNYHHDSSEIYVVEN